MADRSALEKYCRLRGGNPRSEWIDTMVLLMDALKLHYAMTERRWQHFAAQWGHESNGLSIVKENMRFRPARALQVYSYRIGKALERPEYSGYTKAALAAHLCEDPDRLADAVYGGREGTPVGQGHRYIGRGPTQITHLNNYRAICEEIRKQPGGASCPDLVDHPEALEQPEWGIRSAFADWHIKGCNRWADEDNVDAVSSVVNTGSPHRVSIVNGLDSRRRWLSRARATWPDAGTYEAAKAEVGVLRRGSHGAAVGRLQAMLRERGYFPGAVDDQFGAMTEEAVMAFQRDHGLEVDGRAGPLTMAAMEVAPAKEPTERATATVDTLREKGSRKIESADGIDKDVLVAGGTSAVTLAAGKLPEPDAISSWFGALKPIADFLKANPSLIQYASAAAIGYVGWRLWKAYKRSQKIKKVALEEYQTGAYRGR